MNARSRTALRKLNSFSLLESLGRFQAAKWAVPCWRLALRRNNRRCFSRYVHTADEMMMVPQATPADEIVLLSCTEPSNLELEGYHLGINRTQTGHVDIRGETSEVRIRGDFGV